MVTGGMTLKEEVTNPHRELQGDAQQFQVQDDLLVEVHQGLLASPLQAQE